MWPWPREPLVHVDRRAWDLLAGTRPDGGPGPRNRTGPASGTPPGKPPHAGLVTTRPPEPQSPHPPRHAEDTAACGTGTIVRLARDATSAVGAFSVPASCRGSGFSVAPARQQLRGPPTGLPTSTAGTNLANALARWAGSRPCAGEVGTAQRPAPAADKAWCHAAWLVVQAGHASTRTWRAMR